MIIYLYLYNLYNLLPIYYKYIYDVCAYVRTYIKHKFHIRLILLHRVKAAHANVIK